MKIQVEIIVWIHMMKIYNINEKMYLELKIMKIFEQLKKINSRENNILKVPFKVIFVNLSKQTKLCDTVLYKLQYL